MDTSIAYGLTVAPRRDRPAADGAESANANANAAVEPQHKGHGGGGGGGRGGGVTTRDWESRVFNVRNMAYHCVFRATAVRCAGLYRALSSAAGCPSLLRLNTQYCTGLYVGPISMRFN